MQAGSFSLYLLPEDFQPTLSGVTLARSFLGASSSCSHLSLSDTCHCQSRGDKTHTTPSFGLIKSPGSFELINNCCIEILAGPWPQGCRNTIAEGSSYYFIYFYFFNSPVVHIAKMNIRFESGSGFFLFN